MCANMEGSQWDKVLLLLTKFFSHELCKLSPDDLVKFCLEKNIRNVTQDFLNKVKKSNLKNSTIALQKKEEGNQKYKKKQFEESLLLYTESIFNAARDDECLPLAYSNRSMVLERKGYLSESLIDIDMALSCGYPKQKVEKLILRKARCLLQLGDVEKAREILTEGLKSSEKKEYHKIIENELQKIKGQKGKKKLTSEFKLPEPIGGENKNFSYASKHLSLHYNEIRGRHVIANQDIEPGDVLFVEKPFAFITFEKLCFNCCKNTIAPIPCWNCTGAYYCSSKCRDESWDSVHSFECGFAELFKSIGIAHLSLRVVLRASSCLDELKKILSNISEPVYENGSIKHRSNTYEAVYNLVHNSEHYEARDMFQYVMTALLLALYLKNHTSYFPTESDDEDLSLLTSVILRHILQLICNGYCISETLGIHEEGKWLQRISETKTGSAIYTSASMINHSCEPSTVKSFYRNYLIIRAEKAIKKGEEISSSYGPDVKVMKKSRRQEILSKQYFFNCKCPPCLQEFDIQDKFTAFKCNECKGPSTAIEENSRNTVCLSCGQISEISLDVAKKQNKFYSLMEEGEILLNDDVTLSLEKYLQAWRIGREIFYKFHKDIAQAADQVACCLFDLGEYKRCILFLRCCVRSIEERFGSLSFELANEMKKLADIITLYVIENKSVKDVKDLCCEAMLYYRKVKKTVSLFPEYENFKDLEINIAVLEMNSRL